MFAQRTGKEIYYDAIECNRKTLVESQEKSRLPGMWLRNIHFRNQDISRDDTFTLGALSEDLDKYLPKMFLLTSGLEPEYEIMYKRAIEVATEHVISRPTLPNNEDILFSGKIYVRSS